MPPLSDPTRTPRTYRYQLQHPDGCGGGWLPDAVTDTSAKRRAGARRLKGEGCGIIARLQACPGRIYHVVRHLGEQGNLYLDGRKLALAALDRLPPGLPLYWKVCASILQRLHLHMLMAVPDPGLLKVLARLGFHCFPIRDDAHLENVLEYFSRPNDEASARPNLKGLVRHGNNVWEARFAAAERYLEARERHGRRPLPRLSGTRNLPFLKARRFSRLQVAVIRKTAKSRDPRPFPFFPLSLPLHVELASPCQAPPIDWLACAARGPPACAGHVVRPPRPLTQTPKLASVRPPSPPRDPEEVLQENLHWPTLNTLRPPDANADPLHDRACAGPWRGGAVR